MPSILPGFTYDIFISYRQKDNKGERWVTEFVKALKEELGTHWLEPHLFRFGASSLLTDIERQLEHGLTGHYSADYRQPMV